MSENFSGFIKVHKDVILKLCDDLTEGVWRRRQEEFDRFLEENRKRHNKKRGFLWCLWYGIKKPSKFENDGHLLDYVYMLEDTNEYSSFRIDEVSEYSSLYHERCYSGAMNLRDKLRTACKGSDEIYISLDDWQSLKSWETKNE